MVGGVELPDLCWLVAFLLCPSEIQLATEAYPKPTSPPIENHAVGLRIMISNWDSALRIAATYCHCQSLAKIAKEIPKWQFGGRSNMPVRAACSQVSSAMS